MQNSYYARLQVGVPTTNNQFSYENLRREAYTRLDAVDAAAATARMDETRLADQDQINTSMSPEQVREPINIFERRSDLFQITLIVYAYFCVFDNQLNRRVLLYYEDDCGDYFTFFDVK